MPNDVNVVDATVTGTASTGPDAAVIAVKAAASRIAFDGAHLAKGSEGVVLEMALLFRKVPKGPGPSHPLKLGVRAQSGLTAAEAAQQVEERIINLRASIADTKVLNSDEYVVNARPS